MSGSTERRLATGLAIAVAVLADLVVVSGLVLAFVYEPSPGQAWPELAFDGGAAGSVWTGWHRWLTALWLVTSVGSTVATAVVAARTASATRRRVGIALAGGIVAGLAAVVVLLTSPLVQWDQLAIASVSVGDGVQGYGAVFDGDTLFAIVDGAEIEPVDYGVALAVHGLAHLVGGAAAIGAAVALAGRQPSGVPGPDRETTVAV